VSACAADDDDDDQRPKRNQIRIRTALEKDKPDEEITMAHRSRLLTVSAATVLTVAVITSLPRDGASADVDGGATLTYSAQSTTQLTVNPSDVTCPLKVVVEGAALTNLLGPVHDIQSHCINPTNGNVEQGVFTLTGASLGGSAPGGADSQDSVIGHYTAHTVPTPNSVFPSSPRGSPGGYWLIYGQVCTAGGTGKYAHVRNECPTGTSPGHFVPARGTLDYDSGQANVYGTMSLRFE
jgi:hypothetical protein